LGRGVNVAEIEIRRLHACVLRVAQQLLKQRRLAYAAGSIHVEDVEWEDVLHQRVAHQCAFGAAPDNAPPSRCLQAFCQAADHGVLPLAVSR
jgi:hypothetical protein